MEMTAVARRYHRVIIHNRPAWRPGQFFYATDTEVVEAEVTPTGLPGLVQVSGTEAVYRLAPLPGDMYAYTEYHLLPHFPFIRRDKKSIPMQEAIKTGRIDTLHDPVVLEWQKTGNQPFTATLPVSKIEAFN